MHSRAARLMLLLLFLVTLSVAAFLFWRGEARGATEAAQAKTFDESARDMTRAFLDVRAAQQAYVAAGQDAAFWARRVTQGLDTLRTEIKTLQASAVSPDAHAAVERTASALDDLTKVDKRAVDYMRSGQPLLASDLIFGDGAGVTGAGLTAVEQARAADTLARESAVQELRRRQLFALAAAAAAALLAVLLLTPGAASDPAVLADRISTARVVSEDYPAHVEGEGWTPPRRVAPPEPAIESTVPALLTADVSMAEAEAVPPRPVEPPVPSPTWTADFPGVAALCVDLARVVDTRALPSLLDRAATLLDASGIILWIADPDGRELNAIFAQGYPQQLVNRLGTIPRDAENATAAAFRTSLLQTVKADEISPGAIAAPLVTPGGCVGVMAAEVRHDAERQHMMLAAATIVAAQLATLVGPPSARPQSRAASSA